MRMGHYVPMLIGMISAQTAPHAQSAKVECEKRAGLVKQNAEKAFGGDFKFQALPPDSTAGETPSAADPSKPRIILKDGRLACTEDANGNINGYYMSKRILVNVNSKLDGIPADTASHEAHKVDSTAGKSSGPAKP